MSKAVRMLPVRVNGGAVIQKPNLAVITTSWDDGHPLDLRLADLLSRYGLPATFYVPRESGRPGLDSAEIGRLSARFEIGAHTLDHRTLDQLDDHEARQQLSGSRNWIEDLTGKPCRVLCFPAGKFRRQQLRLVRDEGFLSARTVELLSTDFPLRVEGLALISTTVQVYPHSSLAYFRNSLKRRSLLNLVHASAFLYRRDWCELALHLLQRTLQHGGVFHLWGHSWEIEQERQWDRLEELLAVIAANKDKVTMVTNAELASYAQ